jgi:putative hydrolase of the HAD superfamily
MGKFQHYSFDLWLTLIRSNPQYKLERIEYMHRHWNRAQLPVEAIATIFRRIDLMSNAISEKTGKQIDTGALYLMVISEINGNLVSLQEVDMERLYDDMEQLFLAHPPKLYCSKTLSTLQKIKSAGDVTVSLLSNTAFIKGSTLRLALEQLEILQFLDFQLFSDETGIAKPNPRFFELMLQTIHDHRQEPLRRENIVHIGDNVIADIQGAEASGIPAILINANQSCISTVINQ